MALFHCVLKGIIRHTLGDLFSPCFACFIFGYQSLFAVFICPSLSH